MPQVKLIVLLRNPVDRAYSHYNFSKKLKVPFEKAIKLEQKKLEVERNKMMKDKTYNSQFYRKYSFLARGIYIDQLKVFVDYFGKDKILILKSEDLFKDPQGIVNQAFKFLNVSPYKIKNFPIYNKKSYKSPNDSMKEYLSDYFKPHNQRLYEYLGQSFDWD